MSVKVELTGYTHGFKFVVLIHPAGHRCGYVGVPEGHPLFKHPYGKPHESLRLRGGEKIGDRGILPLLFRDDDSNLTGERPDVFFDVHGGLTYSGGDDGYPLPETNGLWWFGFDCAHSGDAPDWALMDAEHRKINSTYPDLQMWGGVVRSLHYVTDQCNKLAEQLRGVK